MVNTRPDVPERYEVYARPHFRFHRWKQIGTCADNDLEAYLSGHFGFLAELSKF